MRTVSGAGQVSAITSGWRDAGESVGFVPTMGALHDGHRSLIDAARTTCGRVVVSIFVNPTQFGPNEDLDRYPRTLREDLAVCEAAGADLVFTPDEKEIYPDGFATTVSVSGLTEGLCGASRPGHFDGVTTVVARLFGIVTPTHAFFGTKDYQQAAVIRRMTEDLRLSPEIIVCPTVREPDGLALSSRNRYLSAAERETARAVPEALTKGAALFAGGETDAEAVRNAVEARLTAAGARVEYVAAVHPDTLEPVEKLSAGVVLLVAAHVGGTRLIDNRSLVLDVSD